MLDTRHIAAALLALSPLLTGVTCGVGPEDLREATRTGELRGDQVVPPVETAAEGRATARLFGNIVSLQGEFSNLGSAVLPQAEDAIRFRLGAAGEADGDVLLAMDAASVDGRTGSFAGDVTLDDELVELFLAGQTWVEVRTEAHPAGELRAQLQ